MLNPYEVSALFENLQTNNAETFFNRVADDVHWTVIGTHPLAGEYYSKELFLDATFKRLNKILKEGVVLRVKHLYLDGNTAIVEMESLSTAANGKPFNNKYCWVVVFNENKMITRVRAYLDSALVQQVIDENE
ncbi:MAG: ketosteroid isomerase [Lentisphaerae bacterium]|nr:ketosteroid isomerase [Lentisphaerota bacterium]MCP4103631.1 ketosteroid isomerase [Lentisphaerota bacterium]